MGDGYENDSGSIEDVLASMRKLMADRTEALDPSDCALEPASSIAGGHISDDDPEFTSDLPAMFRHQPEEAKSTKAGPVFGWLSNRFGRAAGDNSSHYELEYGPSADLYRDEGHAFEPVSEPPRCMPCLGDAHIKLMGESSAWKAMNHVVVSPQGEKRCSGPSCFGATLPDHLVPSGPVADYGGRPLQGIPAGLNRQRIAGLRARSAAQAALSSSAPSVQQRNGSFADSTLDDATAELLRPLLKQWLEDNMTRVFERALHRESKVTGQ
jgi:hypothetical protein